MSRLQGFPSVLVPLDSEQLPDGPYSAYPPKEGPDENDMAVRDLAVCGDLGEADTRLPLPVPYSTLDQRTAVGAFNGKKVSD